ncbi:MAG: MFS transporter [Candidatus Lokiarchaeota archaeon]|nr:MFS transporter [Candidatus Lokiarchaeota archaeon]MBD3338633.1 MFS transporter [Candidatus Lokiarchaeota archaeon]
MKKSSSFKILILLVFISSALFSIISPMAVDIEEALPGVVQAQVLFVVSMFLAVGAVSSLFWGILAGKVSRKRLLIIATLEWSIFELLTVFANDFISLLIFQIGASVGFGAVLPISYSLIVDLFEPEKRGRAFGFKEMAYVIGIGFAFILAGFLVGFFPWYIPVLIVAIGGFTCTILLFFFEEPLKEELYGSESDIDESRAWIRFEDFKDIAGVKSNLWILLFYFIVFIGYGAISPYFTTLLRNDYQFSPEIATIFLILVFLGQIPSGIIFGNLGDKLYEKDKTGRVKVMLLCLVGGSILNIIGFSLILTQQNILMIILFLIFTCLGATFFGGFDPLIQATLGEVNPPKPRSTAFALGNLIVILGRSISILLLSISLGFFGNLYRPGFILLSIFALIASLLALPLMRVLPGDLERTQSKME